jgi:hypothetical protein
MIQWIVSISAVITKRLPFDSSNLFLHSSVPVGWDTATKSFVLLQHFAAFLL